MSDKRVYVREASGLVRGIGALDALFICLAGIAPAAGRFLANLVIVSWPGTVIWLWLTLGAIMCAVHGFLYAQIGGALPRSGGDYILTSRTLHPAIGFMANWALVIYMSLVIGGMVPLINSQGLANTFWGLGLVYNNSALIDLGFQFLTPNWIFIVGTISIVATALLLCLPQKVWLRVFEAIMLLSIGVVVVQMVIFMTTTHQQFVNAWNSFSLLPSYDTVINTATESGLTYAPPAIAPTLQAALLAFWLFFGYIFSAFFAGEVKEYAKSIPIAILGSLALVYIGDIVVMGPGTAVIGDKFVAAVGWLFFVTPGKLPVGLAQYDFASTILLPNPIWIVIVGVAMVTQMVTIFMAYLVITSRSMFAWAFDRILPEKVAYVSEKGRSPIAAILITFGIAEIGLVFSTYTVIPIYFNWMFAFCFITAIGSFSAIIFPFLKKDIFEKAPAFVKYKIAGKAPLMSVVGAIVLGWFLFMAYSIYTVPAIAGPITPETIAVMLGIFALGLIVYYISRSYRLKKEAIDIYLASKEIPPA